LLVQTFCYAFNMKKQIALWSLYDFANSIAIGVFTLYFSQWLVVDQGVADIWFNLIFVGSTVLLLCTAPIVGVIADKKGQKKPFLTVTTLLQLVCLLATSLLIVAFPAHKSIVLSASLLFLLSNYLYQFTFTFYNAMLSDIAPVHLQGLVSGIGQFANFTGYMGGLALTLPLAIGTIYWFGNPGRAQVFLPSVILFFIFVLPVLLFLKDTGLRKEVTINLREEYKTYVSAFKQFIKTPGVARYLIAFFFFNDAVLTTVNNFPIFLEQVFHVSDKTKSLVGLAIFGMAALGGLVGGWLSDKVGLKKSLMFMLLCWAIIFPLLGTLRGFVVFGGLCIFVGLLYGATFAVTRATMLRLAPPEQYNHAFSYYNLFERFSTFLGPVAWGLIATLLVNSGSVRYRFAIGSMGIFILIGLFIVRKLSIPKIASAG